MAIFVNETRQSTPDVQQPQVQNWLGHLQEELKMLHGTIDDLNQKLAPVCRASISKEEESKMPNLVPLAETICIRANEVSGATKKLRAIIESMEL